MAIEGSTLPLLYGPLEPLNPVFHQALQWLAKFEHQDFLGDLNKRFPAPELAIHPDLDWLFVPGSDPRTTGWPMVHAAALPVLVVGAYLVGLVLLSAFVKVLGVPRLRLRPLVFVHNLVLAALSAYMVYETAMAFNEMHGFKQFLEPDRTWCHKLDGLGTSRESWSSPAALRLSSVIYVHFLTKFLELGDTFIMVLKQNWNQISFLHVYHHASVLLTWSLFLKYSPGGAPWFACFFNSLVHVFMYSHYAAASVGIRTPFKAYLTSLQLVQFVLFLYSTVWTLSQTDPSTCGAPLVAIYVGMAQAAVFLVLFLDFFVQAYCRKPKATKAKTE